MAGVTLSGFNGIDFNTILSAVMQSESRPLNDLQTQQQLTQNKDAAFVSLNAIIGKLQTQTTSLTSQTAFSDVAATSSDTTTATVSLGDGAIPGQYDISISQLAKAQVTSSTNGYTATTDTAATGGSISFTIGSDTTAAITITAATTLAELKDQINSQNSGVAASVVNDGTNYKLVISSRETGEANGFTINNSLTNSDGAVVAFAVGQNATTGNKQVAQNAAFTVNGMDIESTSNVVTEAVPGITVSLIKAGDVSVTAQTDYTSLKNSIKTLVSEYNNLRQFYAKQAGGPLGNDSVMREVLQDLKTVLLGSNDNGGRYHYLAEVGLEFTTTGDIKLDETKLNTAIDSYSGDLQKLFQGTTGVGGVFNSFKTTLDNLDGTAGLIKTTRDSLDTTLKSYRDKILAQQLRLDMRKQELMKQYTAADQAMSRLNAITGYLNNLQKF